MTHYSDETIQELFKTEPLKMAILQEIINYLFESQSDENFQVKLHSSYVESYLELAETIDGLFTAERDALKAANAELVKIFHDIRTTVIRLTEDLPKQDCCVRRSIREEFERLATHVKQHEAKQ